MSVFIEKHHIIIKDNIRYRILGIKDNNVIVVQMDTSKRCIFSIGFFDDVLEYVTNGTWSLEKEDYPELVAQEMSAAVAESFSRNQQIIAEVNAVYREGCYLGLANLKNKPPLNDIIKRYDISKEQLRILILRYLQSGCSQSSLVDRRCAGFSAPPKEYTYEPGKRPGRTGDITSEVVLTEYERGLFDTIISHRLATRHGCYSKSFNIIIKKAYNVELDENGRSSYEDIKKLPTLKQFYNYKKRVVTSKKEYIATHSETEHKNNLRPLLGDNTLDAWGIGDAMQVDLVDVDLCLKGYVTDNAIGRAHIYFLTDMATRAFPAYFIDLTPNSIHGLMGLLVNLAANKVELAARYGITITPEQWPSGIIPGACYCDNGSEFKSLRIEEIFRRLGIERNLEPPAMGSMKGAAEQKFSSLNDYFKSYMEESGVIEKTCNSKHNENACININDLHAIVINFIIYNNCRYIHNYPLTPDMIECGVMPRPIELWAYFAERYPYRAIINTQDYLFDCMFEDQASITREGIVFKQVHYLPDPNDTDFVRDMDNHVTSKKIKIRYSNLDMKTILYFRNSRCYAATLNTRKTVENAFSQSYDTLDYEAISSYFSQKRNLDKLGDIINMVFTEQGAKKVEEIVLNAKEREKENNNHKSDSKPHVKNIRLNRQMEKEWYNEQFSPFEEMGFTKTDTSDAGPAAGRSTRSKDKEQPDKESAQSKDREPVKSIGWAAAMKGLL